MSDDLVSDDRHGELRNAVTELAVIQGEALNALARFLIVSQSNALPTDKQRAAHDASQATRDAARQSLDVAARLSLL